MTSRIPLLLLGVLLSLTAASLAFAQGELDFGEAEASEVQSAAIAHPYAIPATIIGLGVVALSIAFVAFALTRRGWGTPFGYTLAQLPISGRTLVTLFVGMLGLVHLFALTEVYLQTRVTWSSTEEYFFYMKLTKLAATTHAHLFGLGTMYTLVATLFLFTRLGERVKTLVLSVALLGGLWDITAWWLIKYASARFEILSILAGAMASLGFLTMACAILYETWLARPVEE